MPEAHPARDPLEQLAEEWRDRLRRGDRFEADEYVARHPELAEEIRELFPAIVMLEELKPGAGDLTGVFTAEGGAAEGPPRLERLGDFRILREVGRGGMGVVYEAEQESLGRRVALKVLPSHALADRHQQKRFEREARATARLHHTNIVPVYGVGEHAGMHYYVMQFIQGAPLDQVLAELKRLRKVRSTTTATLATPPPAAPQAPTAGAPGSEAGAAEVARSLLSGSFRPDEPAKPKDSGGGPRTTSPGPLSSEGPGAPPTSLPGSTVRLPGQSGPTDAAASGRLYYLSVARIGIQVAEALEYANSQGIVHRDIKPSNLLLDHQGTVWVTDFGLAKALADGENLTHTGDIVGTLRYMAPERFTGQADARGDIYSLGLTLYELLVQRPAFAETDRNRLIHQVTHEDPAPPRKFNPDIPRDLETVVLKAIEREPGRRYPTAAALATDLKRFVEDKPIGARRVSARERLWRWCRRNPALAGLAGGVAFLLLVLTVGASLAAVHFQHLAGQEHAARESEARQRQQAVEAREAAEAAGKKEAEQRAKAVAAQQLAEKNFQEARRAIEELLTRVSEGRLKKVPGMQPLRKELLESALKYYQAFVDRHDDDPALKKDLADAYTRVAHILAEVGSRREALPVFDKALQIRTELLRRDPKNKKLNLDLVAHHQAVGNLYARLRDSDAALKSLQSAYDVLLAYSPQDKRRTANLPLMGTGVAMGIPVHASRDLDVLQAFAGVLNDTGAVLQARDPGQAVQIYLQALYIYRNLSTDPKGNPNRPLRGGAAAEHDLARQWRRIGSLMSDLDMVAAATLYQREAIRILERLCRTFPRHPRYDEWQRDLAAAREGLGDLHAARNQLLNALVEYQAAAKIRLRQAQENPAVPDFQNDLAHCLFSLALVYARSKDSAGALDTLQTAVKRQRILVTTAPHEKPYARALARQLMHQARLQKEVGKDDDAQRSYREARGLWERLLFFPEAAAVPVLLGLTLEPAPLPALHGLTFAHVELLSAPAQDYLDLAAVRAATGQDAPALGALHQSLGAGLKSAKPVQSAPEFDALKPRADFQAFLKEVEGRNRALPWVTDYDQARAQAAREKKDLFLYFGASDWVPSDVAFRRGILSQSVVVDYLTRHFVPVLLDQTNFSPRPKNYAKTAELQAKWKVLNFAAMIVADSQGRAYGKTDKGSSEVASWKDAREFLSYLEKHRQARVERDRLFAGAEKAVNDLDRARSLEWALRAVPAYSSADYADIYRRIFLLDRDNQLGLRAKYFAQGLAARQEEIRKLLERRAWQRALNAVNATLDEFGLTGNAVQELYRQRGHAHLGLGRFDRAAADLARGQAVHSGNPEHGLLQVYALVQLGDVPGYRQVCAELLKRYENTSNSWHAFLVAWTCGMAPDTVDNWLRVMALANRFTRPGDSNDYLNLHTLGLLYYRAGDLDLAEQEVRQSLARSPSWPGRNQLLLALIEQRRGNTKEARRWLAQSLSASRKGDLEAPHATGLRDQLVCQQLMEEAAVLFEGPPLADFPLLQARRHRGLMHLKRWDEAAAAIGKQLIREPDNPRLYLERGRCYQQLKQADKSEPDFARALELMARSLEKARATFDQGPQARADREIFDDGYRDLARVRRQLGRVAEAAATLAALAPLWAGDGERLYELARDLAALVPARPAAAKEGGRPEVADLAVATLAKAVQAGFVDGTRLKKDGVFQPLYTRADFQTLWKEMAQRDRFPLTTWATPSRSREVFQARILAGKGQWDQAETHYARAVKDRPGEAPLRLERARFLARRGKWREAILDYDAALPVFLGWAELWMERGRCHAALGLWDRAASDFVRALGLLPDAPFFGSASSKACKELAQWEPAFARAVELRPADTRLWIGRARFHGLRGEWAEAAANYSRVIDSRPLSEEWFEHAAVLLLLGKEDEFHRHRQEMVRRAGERPEPFSAYVLARTGCLRPGSPAEAARLVDWAEQGVIGNARSGWALHILGGAHYRAGNPEQALLQLRNSVQTGWDQGLNEFFLALAQHRLGRIPEARYWLDRATEHLDRVSPAIPGEPAATGEPDWLEAQVLRREAEALLNAPPRGGGS
jgi:serine/threonine protein kinase/tetratricopeptide (TPR) repeat protein